MNRYCYIADWESGTGGKRRWFAQCIDNETVELKRFRWRNSREEAQAIIREWKARPLK